MTPNGARSTPRGMRSLRSLRWTLIVLATACDGAYVLGDARGTAGSGGSGDAGGDSGGLSNGGTDTGTAQAGQGGEVQLGDAGGVGATQSGIVVSPATVPDARLNRAYRVQFAAHGGVEPYSFSFGGGE